MSSDFRDRLASIDRSGGRIPLFPAEVRGVWRTRRTWVQGVLIVLFLALPWIKIAGEPAVFIDLQKKILILFGVKFWAHEGIYVFFLLAALAMQLALLATLFGRAWCGWACPQTVFLDGVFRRIELWTEGNHLQRRQLAKDPWSLSKARKKFAKWLLFVGFSVLITHSFLAYFLTWEKVASMVTHSPDENWGEFVFILFVNALFLFNFTWFREQFCLIVCPYGRIQSILMDSHSLTVHYDAKRGEPRKGLATSATQRGACVDCRKCVQVCPTGIDIRNGSQLECIACTACIDACDEIMVKTKQPKGLISYRTLHGLKPQVLRFRTIFYGILLLGLSSAFAFSAVSRNNLEVLLLRALDAPYMEYTDSRGQKMIANSYRLRIHNRTSASLPLTLNVLPSDLPAATQYDFPKESLVLNVNEFRAIPFVVRVPVSHLQAQNHLKIKIQINNETREAEFVSPTF